MRRGKLFKAPSGGEYYIPLSWYNTNPHAHLHIFQHLARTFAGSEGFSVYPDWKNQIFDAVRCWQASHFGIGSQSAAPFPSTSTSFLSEIKSELPSPPDNPLVPDLNNSSFSKLSRSSLDSPLRKPKTRSMVGRFSGLFWAQTSATRTTLLNSASTKFPFSFGSATAAKFFSQTSWRAQSEMVRFSAWLSFSMGFFPLTSSRSRMPKL